MSDVETPEGEAEEQTEAEADEPTRHGAPVTEALGTAVLHPGTDTYVDVVDALRDEGFAMLVDLTAVDYLDYAAPRSLPASVDAERFEVVASLINHTSGERLRVKVQVADGGSVPTLFDSFPGAENMEREVADMFGITFDDHPDPSRILMPEDWVGHPLRKDYDVGRIPVQFKATSNR